MSRPPTTDDRVFAASVSGVGGEALRVRRGSNSERPVEDDDDDVSVVVSDDSMLSSSWSRSSRPSSDHIDSTDICCGKRRNRELDTATNKRPCSVQLIYKQVTKVTCLTLGCGFCALCGVIFPCGKNNNRGTAGVFTVENCNTLNVFKFHYNRLFCIRFQMFVFLTTQKAVHK